MTSIVFLTPAEEEMLEASQYYERQAHGLGHDFLAEVQRVVHSVVENPHVGTVRRGNCSTTEIETILPVHYDDIVAFERDEVGSFFALA